MQLGYSRRFFYIKPTQIELLCFTDLNPCLGVHCPSFGVCKTYSAHEARCVCYEDCPSYQDPVCTANGTTYDNKCWHELNYCRGLENNLVYHPGSCEGKIRWLLNKFSSNSMNHNRNMAYRFHLFKATRNAFVLSLEGFNIPSPFIVLDEKRSYETVYPWPSIPYYRKLTLHEINANFKNSR